jgi:hypothetical protein
MIAGSVVAVTVKTDASGAVVDHTIEFLIENLRARCQEVRGGEWVSCSDEKDDFVIVRKVHAD